MTQKLIITGSVLLALAVTLGAFGAHALEQVLAENNRTDTFNTASQYHFIHSLGILLLAALSVNPKIKTHILNYCFYFFLAGIILFSGSLYILSITNITGFAIVTPFGGLAFIVGWILLAFSYNKSE